MKNNFLTYIIAGLSLCPPVISCTPLGQSTEPPRMVNGEWAQAKKPTAEALVKTDFEQSTLISYAFIFSGIYSKEASFSGKKLSFIKTKNIWQGSVTQTIDISSNTSLTDNNCGTLKYDQEYIFFANLGGRNKPIHLKTFRKATPELTALLGKPKKQWLRGRLIHNR